VGLAARRSWCARAAGAGLPCHSLRVKAWQLVAMLPPIIIAVMNDASLFAIGKLLRFRRRAARFRQVAVARLAFVAFDWRSQQPLPVDTHQFMALVFGQHKYIAASSNVHVCSRVLNRSGFHALSISIWSLIPRSPQRGRRLSTMIGNRFSVSRCGLHKNHPTKTVVGCRGQK
jgi:hypothetical protein